MTRGPHHAALPLLCLSLLAFLAAPAAGAIDLENNVKEYVLPNGLTFLLLVRPAAPVFSTNITYRVGSAEDAPGRTGLAHLFEHMAFKGTKTIGTRDWRKEEKILERIDSLARELDRERDRGAAADTAKLARLRSDLEHAREEHAKYIVKDEIGITYGENGAAGLNASTSEDLTRYYVSLPANRLELWMYMESERMKGPVFREFYTERDVVMEERRMRTLTTPFGKLYEAFLGTAFLAHPYGQPTVGWMSDLMHLTVEDAREFFEIYYSPANCVISIVGDIDVEETTRLIDKYFGPLKGGSEPPEPRTIEPPQEGERRVEVIFASEPLLLMGYHKPSLPHPDDYAFDVIEVILTSGRTSRLYRKLVDGGMASSVSAFSVPGTRFPNLFTVAATPQSPHTPAELEEAITEELERLGTEPVSGEEMARARKKIETSFLRILTSNSSIADQLTYYEAVAGDYRHLASYLEEIEKVTPAGIMEAAARYLTKENRTVGHVVREGKE
jgi:predicted Zn-dependent peptidase